MMAQIFKAGPSLIFMYFIIMSELSKRKAFPSISYENGEKQKNAVEKVVIKKGVDYFVCEKQK